MTFWHINFFIAVADVILFYLISAKAAHQMKTRHPELCFLRYHWSEKYVTLIKLVLTSICPAINVVMLYVLIVKDDAIVERSIQYARERYAKQVEEENKE